MQGNDQPDPGKHRQSRASVRFTCLGRSLRATSARQCAKPARGRQEGDADALRAAALKEPQDQRALLRREGQVLMGTLHTGRPSGNMWSPGHFPGVDVTAHVSHGFSCSHLPPFPHHAPHGATRERDRERDRALRLEQTELRRPTQWGAGGSWGLPVPLKSTLVLFLRGWNFPATSDSTS